MRESTRQKFANVDWSQTLEEVAKSVGVSRQRAHQVKEELAGNPRYPRKPSVNWWFNGDIDWSLSNKEIAAKVGKTSSCVFIRRRALGKEKSKAKRGYTYSHYREYTRVLSETEKLLNDKLKPHDFLFPDFRLAQKLNIVPTSILVYRNKKGIMTASEAALSVINKLLKFKLKVGRMKNPSMTKNSLLTELDKIMDTKKP